jgi:hypothetical protein
MCIDLCGAARERGTVQRAQVGHYITADANILRGFVAYRPAKRPVGGFVGGELRDNAAERTAEISFAWLGAQDNDGGAAGVVFMPKEGAYSVGEILLFFRAAGCDGFAPGLPGDIPDHLAVLARFHPAFVYQTTRKHPETAGS